MYVSGNKYKVLQLDNMKIVIYLKTPSPKWCVFIKALHSGLRGLCRRGGRKMEEPVRMEDTTETRPSRHNKIETMAACTGPTQV